MSSLGSPGIVKKGCSNSKNSQKEFSVPCYKVVTSLFISPAWLSKAHTIKNWFFTMALLAQDSLPSAHLPIQSSPPHKWHEPTPCSHLCWRSSLYLGCDFDNFNLIHLLQDSTTLNTTFYVQLSLSSAGQQEWETRSPTEHNTRSAVFFRWTPMWCLSTTDNVLLRPIPTLWCYYSLSLLTSPRWGF